jgi:ubiquinone/menaquinone biosynthesis C-methylase UbiE
MENTIWSEGIQGILNLDLSREVRFRDDRKELYLNLLGLKEGMTIVDIGCGPGTLTRKIAKWLEEAEIIGIDRDTKFIDFAKSKAVEQNLRNIVYYEGDALNLPLEDNSVDACISHTIIEHVPNKEFLLEQKRICKPKGRVCVMYSRPDKYIKTEPDLLPKQSQREKELLNRLFMDTDKVNKKYNVGKYWPDSIVLPKLFEEVGFKNIQIDAVAVPIAIDDSRNRDEEKIVIVEGEKQQLFEGIDVGLKLNGSNRLSSKEIDELKELVSNRFNERINLIKDGISIWDYTIIITQIVSGIVE